MTPNVEASGDATVEYSLKEEFDIFWKTIIFSWKGRELFSVFVLSLPNWLMDIASFSTDKSKSDINLLIKPLCQKGYMSVSPNAKLFT